MGDDLPILYLKSDYAERSSPARHNYCQPRRPASALR